MTNSTSQSDQTMEKLEFGDGWTVVRILGSGTFGKVLLLKNNEDEMIAIKKCNKQQNADNWKKEIEILSNLKHPGNNQLVLIT